MKIISRFLLSPFSVFYLTVVLLRNKLFDLGIIQSQSFKIPIISVGNLSTGGTGKTPHTEYIANLLHDISRPVAILSRGYKRKTKGFLLVDESHTHYDVGDEPCQYKKRFIDKNIIIAVDSNRKRGIQEILKASPNVKAIILDDAMQHRYVKAGLNILLTDYYSPYFSDLIVPFGNLREPRFGAKRSDIVVITKSPPIISPIERRDILSKIKLNKNQHLFFSKIVYGDITSIDKSIKLDKKKNNFATIFLFTGIANPYPLEEYLRAYCVRLETFNFPDHHIFSTNEIKKILDNFEAHLSSNKIIVTTEKDLMRLQSLEIMKQLSSYPIYFVPIHIEPEKGQKENFNKLIKQYVSKN